MQLNDFYALGIMVLGIVLTLFGILLLIVHIPKDKILDNYRRARRAMAIAFLFFAVVDFVELAMQDTGGIIDLLAIKMVTISVAFSQAFLFTYACLMLLDPGKGVHKRIDKVLMPILVIIASVFLVFVIFDMTIFTVAVYVFMAVYCAALVYFTLCFTKAYRSFIRRMDNYFSTDEAARLRWVAISFYVALGVGIVALVATWFTSTLFALCFDVFSIWFYTHFGIRLINYLWQFEHLNPAISIPDMASTQTEEEVLPESRIIKLEKKLDKWVAEKRFTEKGLTLDMVAKEIGSNRTYFSHYINTVKNKTFRDWINSLRIEEAKRIMSESPNKNVNEIVSGVGFVERTSFFRQFSIQTGMTPKVWLKENTTVNKS